VTLTLHRGGAPARIAGDHDRLREILDNLLANALRHTPPGGHVEVQVTGHRSQVDLAVADDGEGIPAVHLPHIFDRFYRADPARTRATGGSGIGLTIARALVHAHGGAIHADSAGTGRGARFTVTLPAARAARSRAATGA
jgi:signal transduction histidine kinase